MQKLGDRQKGHGVEEGGVDILGTVVFLEGEVYSFQIKACRV